MKRIFRFGAVCAPIWTQFDVIVALRENALWLERENLAIFALILGLRAPKSPDFAGNSPTQNCSWAMGVGEVGLPSPPLPPKLRHETL